MNTNLHHPDPEAIGQHPEHVSEKSERRTRATLLQFPKHRIVRPPELVAALTAPNALEAQKDVVAGLLVKRARANGREVSHLQARQALEATSSPRPLGSVEEEAEELARLALKRSIRNGIPDTIEQARARVSVGLAALKAEFYAKQQEAEVRLLEVQA